MSDTNTGGSLAIRPDQTSWTLDQQAVLQQSGIDSDVTGAELSAFLHLCQRTQLDPFSRQIYLIGRWNGQQQRKVFTPQTSIDGYRVIAHRVIAEHGATLGYEDTLWCDKSGRWRDVWLSDEPPAAAKVVVVRNGQRFPAVARFSEYVQTKKDGTPIGLWSKMPATMTAKCAEALALRMAFPHDLAGVYTAEEMAQADNPQPERRPQPVKRDFRAEAEQCETADCAVKVYRDAQQAGANDDVLAKIRHIGTELREAERMSEPAQGISDSELYAALGSGHPEVEAAAEEAYMRSQEDVELPADEHAAAVAAFRAFADEHGITDAEQQAYQALGAPLDDVAPKAIWDLLSQLTAA